VHQVGFIDTDVSRCMVNRTKISNAQQAKQIHRYKNIKVKLCRKNAAIWYNKTCTHKQLTLNYNDM